MKASHRCPACGTDRKPRLDHRYKAPCPKCDSTEAPVPKAKKAKPGRPKLSANEDTARISVRLAESVRLGIEELGGNGPGALSKGVRKLWDEHVENLPGPGAPRTTIVEVPKEEYAKMLAEMRRLQRENEILLEGAKG